MIISIVAAVVIFAILIVVHEAGHFVMAKRVGVRVLRFSIGYPPRLFGIRRGETDYAFGATPLGGYVRMLGDEIAEEPSAETITSYLGELKLDLLAAAKTRGGLVHAGTNAVANPPGPGNKAGDATLIAMAREIEARPHDFDTTMLGRKLKPDEAILLGEIARCAALEQAGSVERATARLAEIKPVGLVKEFNARAFPSQPLHRRFAIVLAGPASNILFAPLLMTIVLMFGVPTLLPVLGALDHGMPGYAAGLREGDHVTAIDGVAIDSWDAMSRAVKDSSGRPLDLAVQRGQDAAGAIHVTVRPELLPEETIYGDHEPTWIIGVKPSGAATVKKLSLLKAIPAGVAESARMAETLVIGIGKIVAGKTPVRQALGGPIMIAQIAGREAHQGFAEVALFMVTLSLELGIINLLPVPLLDGGHLLFFAIEGIRGEPLKLRHREIAMQVGLFLLAILMAFVILNDISRLIG
ncbi:MAG TPA: site-2 protease family protein [Candidatus Binataceae bacterium]|nr:site-2 protease family protein [Candidatus Binataceae bacterium]